MGKGDKKSKKGKIAIGSYGNSRKRHANRPKAKNGAGAVKAATESAGAEGPAKPKKAARKKSEA
jgi:30S ribosomal protein S31